MFFGLDKLNIHREKLKLHENVMQAVGIERGSLKTLRRENKFLYEPTRPPKPNIVKTEFDIADDCGTHIQKKRKKNNLVNEGEYCFCSW